LEEGGACHGWMCWTDACVGSDKFGHIAGMGFVERRLQRFASLIYME